MLFHVVFSIQSKLFSYKVLGAIFWTNFNNHCFKNLIVCAFYNRNRKSLEICMQHLYGTFMGLYRFNYHNIYIEKDLQNHSCVLACLQGIYSNTMFCKGRFKCFFYIGVYGIKQRSSYNNRNNYIRTIMFLFVKSFV